MRNHLYDVWVNMRQRCRNPHNPEFTNYGSRGIKICKEWESFQAFEEWAMGNGYCDGVSIDRIDNDGDYEPKNCRWADKYTQASNKRSGRNRSGANGIHQRPNGKFRVQVMRNGERFNVGDFASLDDAIDARRDFLDGYKQRVI